MYETVKNIKANAREKLLSHMGIAVFFTITHLLITNLFSFCITCGPVGDGVWGLIFYIITSIFTDLFFGILQMGVAAFYLNLSTERTHCSLSDLWYGFTHSPDRALKVSLMLSIIHLICTLPYIMYTLFIMPEFTMDALLAMDNTAINSIGTAYSVLGAGELIYFIITLMFAPVYFMLVDMPNLTATKAMKMSIWLMKGSKFRLLGLELSFLPLQFISLFTFGIGNLWVIPYIQTAATEFYLDLSAKRANQ